MQIYTSFNRSGQVEELTEEKMLNTQAHKRRLALNGGKPITYVMNMSQLSQIYASAVNTDYATVKPKYISIAETGAKHYGLNMFINRVDNKAFNDNGSSIAPQYIRINTTYYMAFKGVE